MAIDISSTANRVAYKTVLFFDDTVPTATSPNPILRLPADAIDYTLVFRCRVYDETGTADDCDLATSAPDSMKLLLTHPNGLKSEKTLVARTAATGKIDYDVTHTDFEDKGTWTGQIELKYPDAVLLSNKFPISVF